MNPSNTGWIKKLGSLLGETPNSYKTFEELYQYLKTTGFVYGIHLKVAGYLKPTHQLSEDEVAKVNLFMGFYHSYKLLNNEIIYAQFVQKVFDFYKAVGMADLNFFQKILGGKHTETQLEKLIDQRIYPQDNPIGKLIGNSLTNALLFIDILTFKHYLKHPNSVLEYARKLEYVTLQLAYQTLNSKVTQPKDYKLMQLLENSITFSEEFQNTELGSLEQLINQEFGELEQQYFLDMTALTAWDDSVIETNEWQHLYQLGSLLNKTKADVAKAMEDVISFFNSNYTNITYLKNHSLSSQYYEGMTKNVSKIILRNKTRLQRELEESRELMHLLRKSTLQELNNDERKRIKSQLLDLFKTIPSLAIFMLPGGAVLLPLFIKLIPKLLPSSFDDNRVG